MRGAACPQAARRLLRPGVSARKIQGMTATSLSVPPGWLTPVWLRRELLAAGYNDRALARRVVTGELARSRRGAYVDGAVHRNLDRVGRYQLLARSVLAQARTTVSLSHGSALLWHGAPDYGIDLRQVDVTRHDGRSGRAEAGVRQHRGTLLDDEMTSVHGVPVTTATRAVLEFTTVADLEAAVVQMSMMLHAGLTTAAQLEEGRARMVDWPSSLQTDIVCRLADGRLESVAEARFLTLCFRHSVPRPDLQYVVRDRWQHEAARLDFAWPHLRKWAEMDGKVKYEKLLRAGERASDVVLREKRREAMVRDLTGGWECERFDYDDLAWGDHTAARLKRFLGCEGSRQPWDDMPGVA
jgi:hypothetical protein